jgi:hypothetical protein
MHILEAMERTENTYQAVKLLDDIEQTQFVQNAKVETQTGKIYDIYNLGLNSVAIKAEGGVFTLDKADGLKKEEIPYEEVIHRHSLFESVKKAVRQNPMGIKRLIRDNLRKTYLNPYTGYLHVIYTDGRARRSNIYYGFTNMSGLIDDKIICDFEESQLNNKIYYKLVGNNKDILGLVEGAEILYHSIFFLPKKELMDKLYKVYRDYRVNEIPSEISDTLYGMGFVPYENGVRRRDIGVRKTPYFLIFTSTYKTRMIKLNRPNLTRKLQKILIDLSV